MPFSRRPNLFPSSSVKTEKKKKQVKIPSEFSNSCDWIQKQQTRNNKELLVIVGIRVRELRVLSSDFRNYTKPLHICMCIRIFLYWTWYLTKNFLSHVPFKLPFLSKKIMKAFFCAQNKEENNSEACDLPIMLPTNTATLTLIVFFFPCCCVDAIVAKFNQVGSTDWLFPENDRILISEEGKCITWK